MLAMTIFIVMVVAVQLLPDLWTSIKKAAEAWEKIRAFFRGVPAAAPTVPRQSTPAKRLPSADDESFYDC